MNSNLEEKLNENVSKVANINNKISSNVDKKELNKNK